MEKNSDLLALERQLTNQADRLAALGTAPVSPRITHTPDSVQLFQLLERLHKLVGPHFPRVMSDEDEVTFIHKVCDWFNHVIPKDKKRELILAIDKDTVIDTQEDLILHWVMYRYLKGSPPRARRGEPYRTEDDAVVEEVQNRPQIDTLLPSNDRSKFRKSPFEKESPRSNETLMPIMQLLTDLKTMHACM